jgi:hypothetical protein
MVIAKQEMSAWSQEHCLYQVCTMEESGGGKFERRDKDFEIFNIQILKVHLVVKAWSWKKNKICNKMSGPCTCLAIQVSTIL